MKQESLPGLGWEGGWGSRRDCLDKDTVNLSRAKEEEQSWPGVVVASIWTGAPGLLGCASEELSKRL